MSTNAISAQGTKFYVGDVGSPQGFTAIPEVKTIGGPSGQRNMRQVTDLDSTAHEFKANLKDEGEITLGIFYIPQNAVHITLRNAYANGTQKNFRMEFVDTLGTTWDFYGYVKGFNAGVDVDGDVTATVTIKITGAITEGT